jgi:thiol-disulfide isomerase/thioredoxin
MRPFLLPVILAKARIPLSLRPEKKKRDSRFRGNDGIGVALLLALTACDSQPQQPAGGAAPEGWAGPAKADKPGTGTLDRAFAGRPAPRSIFQDPKGEAITLADMRGKPLLVNLWATWCPPCIAEMPTLDALAKREPGLKVLTVSQDLNGQDKVDAFFAARRFEKLEPYLDPQILLMQELGVSTLPITILYDSQGREVWRMTGIEDWTGARAAELIKEAG